MNGTSLKKIMKNNEGKIVMTKLEQYLLEHIKQNNESIVQLEAYAKEKRIPIMDPISIHFLMQMIRMKQPKQILEIGTAIGYSAIRMHDAYPETTITTIERNDDLYNQSLKNIKQFNKQQNIRVIHGDALNVLQSLANDEKKPIFDLIFIDAAKAQYKRFFKLVEPMLNDNGVIISDNVLFQGLVVENNTSHKRLSKLANKVAEYNKWLTQLENYSTSIVPIGDGIAISMRI